MILHPLTLEMWFGLRMSIIYNYQGIRMRGVSCFGSYRSFYVTRRLSQWLWLSSHFVWGESKLFMCHLKL